MILYNVTVKVENAIADEWEQWMREVHIPDVMMTNLFIEFRLMRLLLDDEDDGITFAVQYLCRDMGKFKEYNEKHAKKLQEEHAARYSGRYVAFRTLMEMVDHNSQLV